MSNKEGERIKIEPKAKALASNDGNLRLFSLGLSPSDSSAAPHPGTKARKESQLQTEDAFDIVGLSDGVKEEKSSKNKLGKKLFNEKQLQTVYDEIGIAVKSLDVPSVDIHLDLDDGEMIVGHSVTTGDAVINTKLTTHTVSESHGLQPHMAKAVQTSPENRVHVEQSPMEGILESVLTGKEPTLGPQLVADKSGQSRDHRVQKYHWKHKEITWSFFGIPEKEPNQNRVYFDVLALSSRGFVSGQMTERIVSVCIPCYNEEAHELRRTLFSLRNQELQAGFNFEIVVIFDGVSKMSKSMSQYLHRILGISLNAEDNRAWDPFVAMPDAETIIIEPADLLSASARPTWGGTKGGISLVIKRGNHRKANSHMWWLGAHAKDVKCELALATDCGTVFMNKSFDRMMNRLDAEPSLAAVTGFQRVMSSQMQGDGEWEILRDPKGAVLRMIQRFEFEADQSGHKPLYDTIGFLPVIPGPCGLYRYDQMGSLNHGVMQQYFAMVHRKATSLILGNVQLAEDRIPSCLLVFRTFDILESTEMPKWGWPKTGYVHDAVFYTEAEKPFDTLIKQRRRWLNGTFAGYVWVLQEHLITKAYHEGITKFYAKALVLISIAQGLMTRMAGIAVVTVWIYAFGLVCPDIVSDPSKIFYYDRNIMDLENEPIRFVPARVLSGGYLLLYIAFVAFHIPVAKPAYTSLAVVRYTEATKWQSDHASAYRSWLFLPSVVVNVIVMLLFLASMIGTLAELGWSGTPILVRILFVSFFLPFMVAFTDGIVNQYPPNFRAFGGMLYAAPAYIPMMIWFSIWLPAYASARVSDLTWGNRESTGDDESELALQRQATARRVASVMVTSNVVLSILVIVAMRYHGLILMVFILTYTSVLSLNYLITIIDQIGRLMSKLFDCCVDKFTEKDPEEAQGNNYVSM